MAIGFPDDDALRRMLEQQRKIAEALASNDAIQRAFEQQRQIAEAFTSGDAIKQVLEQQQWLADQLNSPAFEAYRAIAADAVAAGSNAVHDDLADTSDPSRLLDGWLPSREEAEGLVDIVTFLVAFLWFLLAVAGTDVPETTQRAVDAALAFAVVMAHFARK